MDWKIPVFIIILALLVWFIYKHKSQPITTVEIKAVPRSQQVPNVPAKPVDSIAPYFVPAREAVPVDSSMVASQCPFSRPLSTDLPIVDVPRCMLLSKSSDRFQDWL